MLKNGQMRDVSFQMALDYRNLVTIVTSFSQHKRVDVLADRCFVSSARRMKVNYLK